MNTTELKQALEGAIQSYPRATVAVAFHAGQTGEEILVRPYEPFHPASTFKICVMMEVYRQASQGLLSLEDDLPVTNQFTSIADGSPFSLSAEDDAETGLYGRIGQAASLRELVGLMITRSSNLATNLLIRRVTAARVSEYMAELGAPDLQILRGPEDNRAYARGLNNVASAYGLMHILRLLAEGQVVAPAASAEMIRVLLAQEFNEGIPAGLPEGVRAAHKTGWNPLLYHDAGIVFPPGSKPYVLVVMTRGIAEDSDGLALVATISRLCYRQSA